MSEAKKKLLVVDDEKEFADLLKKRLEINGYEVVTAHDGQEGLEKVKAEKPDLIILDLMLPKIDGYKVCGLLKRDNRFRHIPIILFTARAQEADIKLGQEVGAEAYLTKPYVSETLLAEIRRLLPTTTQPISG